jgi:HEAT repeat protein
MAKQSFDQKLARLKQLESEPKSDDSIREIKKALSDSNGMLVSIAARLAAKMEIRELEAELIAAFYRLAQAAAKSDPGCRAKIAIIDALNAIECPNPEAFLIGIHHVQMEYSFGPPTDTADQLRADSLFSLYRMGYPNLLSETVTLLADREPVARRAAIRVLKELGSETSEMLLRLKTLHGDGEAEVLGDCFNALMTVAPMRSIKFVAQFLSGEDLALAEEAALAIGNSRIKEGFNLLREMLERSASPAFKATLFLAIALTRCDEAYLLLLDIVRNERAEYAAAAVQALSIYSDNSQRCAQIHEASLLRNDPVISEAYRKSIEKRK